MRRARKRNSNEHEERNQGNASVQPFDVLLGRGKSYDKHLGNSRYKDLIASNTTRYFEALSGEEKRVVSYYIVDEVGLSGGRFLQRGHRCWITISRDEARLKVAQAFQYQRRKVNKMQEINHSVLPPPFQRQNHYMPGFHSQTREAMAPVHFLGRSEANRSIESINSTCSQNDDVLPFVASLSFDTDCNLKPSAQAKTERRRDEHSEGAKGKLKRLRASSSPPEQHLEFGSSVAMMSSYRSDGESVKDSKHVKLRMGKTDPNARKLMRTSQHQTATPSDFLQRPSHNTLVVELPSNKSSFPNEQNESMLVPIHGKVEGTLDGSGVHSIGMSSDDEQQSLISVLANMNADAWTENEDPASNHLK